MYCTRFPTATTTNGAAANDCMVRRAFGRRGRSRVDGVTVFVQLFDTGRDDNNGRYRGISVPVRVRRTNER